MDAKIGIGDKIDLEKIEKRLSVDPNKNVEIYVSQVLDEAPNGNMYIAMPIKEGKLIPMSVGQEFEASFYSRNGLLQCRIVVVGRYKKGSIFLMEVEQLTVLKKVQRREYYRMDCRTPILYRLVDEAEKTKIETHEEYMMDIDDLEWKKAVMLDVSGGGMRFVSNIREEKDIIVHVRFSIGEGENEQILYAFAKILRVERNANNTALYDSHLKFWNIDPSLRETIIRLIFDEQRRKMSKKLS